RRGARWSKSRISCGYRLASAGRRRGKQRFGGAERSSERMPGPWISSSVAERGAISLVSAQWPTNHAANGFNEQRPVHRTSRRLSPINLVLAVRSPNPTAWYLNASQICLNEFWRRVDIDLPKDCECHLDVRMRV